MDASLRTALQSALGDRYTLGREIGRGGMAVVYLAEDRKHQRNVALKVMQLESGLDDMSNRFAREIAVAARLAHPHIVPLHDSGSEGELLWYVMPYFTGETLRDRMKREGQLPMVDAARIAHEIATALAHAHAHDVLHRDIKPENILLQDGRAVVADFGIGKFVTPSGDPSLTRAGFALGTPAYVSPEQAAGELDVDGRSDVYSLGCVIHEMIAGQSAFPGDSPVAQMAARFVKKPPSLDTLRPNVPPHIVRAVSRALAMEAADRPTAAELARELAADPEATRPAPVAIRVDTTEPEPLSIVVLPFANMSGDPDNEYFSDGVTEEILNVLSQIPGWRVAARTTSFAFKGKQVAVRDIGEQLGVRTVLEGSVRRAGNRVRITAELVDVETGFGLWGARYDRELADVFAVQDEIAQAIAETLRGRLLGHITGNTGNLEQPSVTARHSSRIEAYELYLKGRHALSQRDGIMSMALEYFRRATEVDPGYALAWAGLAECYMTAGNYYFAPLAESWRLASHAARRALELDDALAEAHGVAGGLALFLDWDAQRAFEQLTRALEINPQYNMALHWLGMWHVVYGTPEDCEAQLRKCVAVDPLAPLAHCMLATGLGMLDRVSEALVEFERTLELDPSYLLAHYFMTVGHAWQGRVAESAESAERALAASRRSSLALGARAVAYGAAHDAEGLQRVTDEIRSRFDERTWPNGPLLGAYMLLGDDERATKLAKLVGETHDFLGLATAFSRQRMAAAHPVSALLRTYVKREHG